MFCCVAPMTEKTRFGRHGHEEFETSELGNRFLARAKPEFYQIRTVGQGHKPVSDAKPASESEATPVKCRRSPKRSDWARPAWLGTVPRHGRPLPAPLAGPAGRQAAAEWARTEQDRAATVDRPLAELCQLTDLLLTAALTDAGYHRQDRGPWRKKRRAPDDN